ncbi:MAG: hypothetical protein ABFS56_35245 [Pseudomonadota bacterium]
MNFRINLAPITQLLDSKVDQVLKAVGSLGDIDKNVKSLLQEV